MRGFQLIEVVIAGAIFFMISLFLLNLLPVSLWAVSKAETKFQAENLAYSTLGELRSKPFSQLTIGSHSGPTLSHEGVELVTEFTVARVPQADPELLKDVTVTVTWTVRDEHHVVRARSYVSRLR